MFENFKSKNPEITKYYIRGLIPFLLLIIIFELTPLETMSRFFVYLGYVWPYTIGTPTLREKVNHPKYRFSFMRLVFNLDSFFESIIGMRLKSLSFIVRVATPPFLYCLFIFSLTGDSYPFLSFIGTGLYYVLFHYFYKKLN